MNQMISILLSMFAVNGAAEIKVRQGEQVPDSSFSLYLDQDVFFGPAFDQDFTMGVLATWTNGWVTGHRVMSPLLFIDQHMPPLCCFKRKQARESLDVFAFSLGDSAFTPQKANLHLAQALPYDRPYANLLFASTKHERSSNTVWRDPGKPSLTELRPGRLAYSTELTLGVLGLGVGKATQTWIHRHISDDIRPEGWDNQVSLKVTGRYRAVQKILLWDQPALAMSKEWFKERQSDGHVFVEQSVGFYTSASAGFRFRFGKINSAWWTGDRMPNSVVKRTVAAAHEVTAASGLAKIASTPTYGDSELFLSAGLAGTVWARNQLMQGRGDSKLSFRGSCPDGVACLTRFNYDAQAGLTWRRRDFTLSYQVTFVSPLFKGVGPQGERLDRWHNWGGLYAAWSKQGGGPRNRVALDPWSPGRR